MNSMRSIVCSVATLLVAMPVTISANGCPCASCRCCRPVAKQPPEVGGSLTSMRDNSAKLFALQSRLWRLRMDLEDARANLNVAIAQRTGWVSANMRVMTIMRHISLCERRIMELMR